MKPATVGGGILVFAAATGGVAHAGVLDEIPESQRHVAFCRVSAEEAESSEDWDAAHGIWNACVTEAERRKFDDVLPAIRAQRSIAATLAEAAPLRITDPHHWALQVLQEASQYSTIDLPSDTVRRTFRRWMETDQGRAYVEDWRTITVQWTDRDATTAQWDEALQNELKEAGLKWAPNGSPDVDVVLTAHRDDKVERGDSSKLGHLLRAEVSMVVTELRFRRSRTEGRTFRATASAEEAEVVDAEKRAIHDAADLAAQAILQRILAGMFPAVED